MTTSAREEILRRIRAALADRPGDDDVPADGGPPAPGGAATASGGSDDDSVTTGGAAASEGGIAARGPGVVDLFVERVADYRAEVERTSSVEEDVARLVSTYGVRRLVVPPDLPDGWLAQLPEGVVVRDEPALSPTELDEVDAVLTACAVGIAETGTIVLDAGAGQGRRAVTLVPDIHICVVREADVVPGVPEALVRLDPSRPLTWISGPSATSDIELTRVEGVHGPRTLHVLLLR